MGDLTTLAKARRELEDLYLGIPDESVNLTFKDLAEVTENVVPPPPPGKRKAATMEAVPEGRGGASPSPLTKLPSLDFNRGLQAAKTVSSTPSQEHHHHDHHVNKDRIDSSRAHSHHHLERERTHGHHYAGTKNFSSHASPNGSWGHFSGHRHEVESSMPYNDSSRVSVASILSPFSQRGRRRRPGIPHSNICAICNTYIYIFRHRCLVCGRVYCRSCLSMGMGEMTEGRKCTACLGRRFSQRYIKRAGDMGCCCRYPSVAKQQELVWAEKGARMSGEGGQTRSVLMSTSTSPVTPGTPTWSHHHTSNHAPSFVMGSPFSPYSPAHRHPIPF